MAQRRKDSHMKNFMLIAIVLLISSSANGQGWKEPMNVNGAYRTRVKGIGKTPDGASKTLFSVRCYPGKKGYINFAYGVRDIDAIKGFNFGEFEGPDAPAGTKKLVTVMARTSKENIIIKTSVSGGRTIGNDPGAFEFRFGANIHSKGEMMRLANALARGVSTLSVTVQDSRDRRKILYTEFPVTNAANVVAHMLKECGKP